MRAGKPFLELVSKGAVLRSIKELAKAGAFSVVCNPELFEVIEVEVPSGE
jgi:hypothetical protein